PVNRFVAGFIGSSNFVEARTAGTADASGRVDLSCDGGPAFAGRLTDTARPGAGAAVTIALRPESILLTGETAGAPGAGAGWTGLPGRVLSGTYLGDQVEYRVDVPGMGELISRAQTQTAGHATRAYGPGESVRAWWHEDATLVLTS
ncbi:MAG TPA: TOBE domain-containing protein, partial [Candidatus Limnocylindrales bacterium]